MEVVARAAEEMVVATAGSAETVEAAPAEEMVVKAVRAAAMEAAAAEVATLVAEGWAWPVAQRAEGSVVAVRWVVLAAGRVRVEAPREGMVVQGRWWDDWRHGRWRGGWRRGRRGRRDRRWRWCWWRRWWWRTWRRRRRRARRWGGRRRRAGR